MLTGCRAVFGGLQLHKYKVEGGSPCLKEYLLTSLIRFNNYHISKAYLL